MKTRRAIVSVHDKAGVVEFARALARLGYEIVSTGGTATALEGAGIPVTRVSDVTGFPEILDGRVKTLHPAVHAGILARGTPEHERELEEHGIARVDLVAVNLYPFVKTVSDPDVALEVAVENIDIGGPTMVRAAAKNFERVVVVTNPQMYPEVVSELESRGEVSLATRMRLALEAFRHTADYDRAIAEFLARRAEAPAQAAPDGEFPEAFSVRGTRLYPLRYGENPHQAAAFYGLGSPPFGGLAGARQVQGKPLSFNNILDADAAVRVMREFSEPCAVVIKHTNPCGVAVASDLATAYVKARDADPVSAFGSVIALGGALTADVAAKLIETFVEVVIARGATDDALELLASRKNVRVLLMSDDPRPAQPQIDVRWVDGGFLVQQADAAGNVGLEVGKVVTSRPPSEAERRWLAHAMRVAKHVKSNAIVLWRDDATVGVGAGQMNRVGSVRIAAAHAGDKARGSVMASDAFFPFRDGIDEAAAAGVTAIVQPGGSVRDSECVDAANEHGMAMVFTGVRHFRH